MVAECNDAAQDLPIIHPTRAMALENSGARMVQLFPRRPLRVDHSHPRIQGPEVHRDEGSEQTNRS